MDNNFMLDEDLTKLNNEELLNLYNEVDSFLKLVNDDIKKTDIGDTNEENR